MNNCLYIVQATKNSELETILGDVLIQKHTTKVRQLMDYLTLCHYVSNYYLTLCNFDSNYVGYYFVITLHYFVITLLV